MSLKVLKSIQEKNPTKAYIEGALFSQSDNGLSLDPKSINKSIISMNSQNNLSNVTTFHELYQKVNETDKALKNPLKLSLKQLEVKKKEKLINKDISSGLGYDTMLSDAYSGFAQHKRGDALYHKTQDNTSSKFETTQMFDSSKLIFSLCFYRFWWS